jgi:hypothetical protein
MTRSEAATWLRQIKGETLRNAGATDMMDAWISLVRVPAGTGGTGTLIVAFGATMEDATTAAEERWHALWRAAGPAN